VDVFELGEHAVKRRFESRTDERKMIFIFRTLYLLLDDIIKCSHKDLGAHLTAAGKKGRAVTANSFSFHFSSFAIT
jgi:hypothetical protein